MAFLIQGLFYQNKMGLYVEHSSRTGSLGPRIMIHENLNQYMYAGAMWLDPDARVQILVGIVYDVFGHALLSNIEMSKEAFSFTKSYASRPLPHQDEEQPPINYSFRIRDGQSWVGEYSGRDTGTGVTRCILTEVPEDFFSPDPLLPLLGRDRPFDWRAPISQ